MYPLSPWRSNHWEDGAKRRPSPSAESAVTWVRGPAHPQEKSPATFFYVLPSPCGEATQANGLTVCQPPLPGLMETLETCFVLLLFVLHSFVYMLCIATTDRAVRPSAAKEATNDRTRKAARPSAATKHDRSRSRARTPALQATTVN